MNTERSIQLTWFKSTHSGDEGGECVEVAVDQAAIRVRDSKELSGPHLAFTRDAWSGFVGAVGRDRSR